MHAMKYKSTCKYMNTIVISPFLICNKNDCGGSLAKSLRSH
jgi:hypothetical protein